MTGHGGAPRSTRRWRRAARPGLLLVLGGVSIYLLLPSLLSVFGSWRTLSHLDWPFAALVFVSECLAVASGWELLRIGLHTTEWFPVATAQLTGNAVGRLLPGGGATAAAFSAGMLRRAGVDTGEAVSAFTASTLLQLGTTFALPILALPAILGGAAVNHSLRLAAYLGIALFGLLVAGISVAFASDRPLTLLGRAIERVLNATVRRRRPVKGVAGELLGNRDFIRSTLGGRRRAAIAAAAGTTLFDYFALLAALRAVGAEPQPSLVLLAYAAGEVLALIPFTPGGLGFVEAGLVGTLALAGVPSQDALAATLLYRIFAYWLPLPAGGIAYLLFRRRYGREVRT
jgi:uncharacterized protein (TIRG00374 family)